MPEMRTLAFDLDGTLADSLPDIAAALNAMLAARGFPPFARAEVRPMVGDGLEPLIARAFASRGRTPDAPAAAEYLALYEARVAEKTALFPGIAAALDTLRARSWRLAVCTNKPERAARALLAALGIGALFDAVGGGDSFPVRKPDPDHLRLTLAVAGADPSRSLAAGDHANDVAAARGAGIPAIFCAWGYGDAAMADGAAALAATPGDLPALAERLLPA